MNVPQESPLKRVLSFDEIEQRKEYLQLVARLQEVVDSEEVTQEKKDEAKVLIEQLNQEIKERYDGSHG